MNNYFLARSLTSRLLDRNFFVERHQLCRCCDNSSLHVVFQPSRSEGTASERSTGYRACRFLDQTIALRSMREHEDRRTRTMWFFNIMDLMCTLRCETPSL